VIGLPPSDGTVQLTTADAFPPVAVTPVGAAGAVGAEGADGVTALDAAETGPLPTAFVAVTLNV